MGSKTPSKGTRVRYDYPSFGRKTQQGIGGEQSRTRIKNPYGFQSFIRDVELEKDLRSTCETKGVR